MPNDRPSLPDDTPTRTVRGYFDQPFRPAPGRIFTTPTVSQQIAGYTPQWPTPPHQRLEGSDTIGHLYGDDGDPLQPFVWVGVTTASWMPGLSDMTQAQIDALGTMPVVTDDAVPPDNVWHVRMSVDMDFADGGHYIPMTANDRLYALPTNGKIAPTLPAYRWDAVYAGWWGLLGYPSIWTSMYFTDSKRSRNTDLMPAFSLGSALLVRDPTDRGKTYVLGGLWWGNITGASGIYAGNTALGFEFGADISERLCWSSFSDYNFLTHKMVDATGGEIGYVEHGLAASGHGTSANVSPLRPLANALFAGLDGLPGASRENSAQMQADIDEAGTGLGMYGDDGLWEYLLYPHVCPSGGVVTGAAKSGVIWQIGSNIGTFYPYGGDDTDADLGYDYFRVDLVFYRPQYGPNPIVQVTYPPPPPQTHELRIDLTPPPGGPSGAGEYYFQIRIGEDGFGWFGDTEVFDWSVADVSTVDVSAIVDDMITAFNADWSTEWTLTRQADDAGQAVVVFEAAAGDTPYDIALMGEFYIYNGMTGEEWRPMPYFDDVVVPAPEEPDPIYDDPTTWGWFADTSQPPDHVIVGQPRTGWFGHPGGADGPDSAFNDDHTIMPHGLAELLYEVGYAGWDWHGSVPDGPWIAAFRVRYLKVAATTTITVYERVYNRDGTITVVPKDIEVPADPSIQAYCWRFLDQAGLLAHYSVRSVGVPTGPVANTVISPWAHLLDDDSIVPGHVDTANVITVHNWLDP